MKFKEMLNERFINVFTPEDKAKYMDEVWELIEIAYADIGGAMGATKENLINTPGIWKLVRKNGKIIAGKLYKDLAGRKSRLLLHDGSNEAKKWVKKIMKDDVAHGRAWGEVSGAVEHIMLKLGAIPVSNMHAEEILGKQILELNPDGYHYTRDIGGKATEKIIIGNLEGW